MRQYETVFLIVPNLEEEDTAKIITQIAGIVTKKKGKLIQEDRWGKKKLAYPIKKFEEAFYVFFHYEGDSDIPFELEKRFKQTEEILRFLTVKKETRENVRKKRKGIPAAEEAPVTVAEEEIVAPREEKVEIKEEKEIVTPVAEDEIAGPQKEEVEQKEEEKVEQKEEVAAPPEGDEIEEEKKEEEIVVPKERRKRKRSQKKNRRSEKRYQKRIKRKSRKI